MEESMDFEDFLQRRKSLEVREVHRNGTRRLHDSEDPYEF